MLNTSQATFKFFPHQLYLNVWKNHHLDTGQPSEDQK